MTKEEAIPVTLLISQIGQLVYFQVPLPTDVEQVIGFEYSTGWSEGVPINIRSPHFIAAPNLFVIHASKLIGKLTLWVPGPENIFFQAYLQEDTNMAYGEVATSVTWNPVPWIHCRKREEHALRVNRPVPFLEGYFQDRWGVGQFQSLSYQLHLYVWIDKCIS